MKRIRIPGWMLVGLLVALGGALGWLTASAHRAAPQERYFTVKAHRYAYDPSEITVNQGDRVHIRFVAEDVTHGFYLEGYDLDAKARPQETTFWMRHPSQGAAYHETKEIAFVANRAGKFHYRCSITCGYMHPFMNGVLIVRPNYLYSASLGMAIALAVGLLWTYRRPSAGGQP